MKSLSKDRNILGLLISVVCFLLSGCASNFQARINNAESMASAHNFEKKLIKGGDFIVATFQRVSDETKPYVFYLEGDGHVTEGRSTISSNPTPASPIALELAFLDPRPNIVYIARPCQYTSKELDPKCSQIYWTDKRMSDEIVTSINDVINKVNNNKPFSLVGFSGGGGIAIMIAARNRNVHDIITVAGNLDHISFSDYHKTLHMTGSLNPINYAKQINNISQLHLSGGRDERVPGFIAQQYVKASNSICVQQKIIPNATHNKGWNQVWDGILQIKRPC